MRSSGGVHVQLGGAGQQLRADEVAQQGSSGLGDLALARAAWATLNGLVDLELAGRFPPGADLDAVYAAAARVHDQARPTSSP